jgi:putative colanic acid biosynthesis acetyltransferase WcaF
VLSVTENLEPATSAAHPPELDIAANRAGRKYGVREILARVAWGAGSVAFRWSPRALHGLRRGLLRAFGANVGREVHVSPSARVTYPWLLTIGDYAAVGDEALLYNLGPLTIGPRATVSQRAHLCGGSHDHGDPTMPLRRLPIIVEADAWVCADAYVGPGVTVGKGAVVGARAAVFQNVEPWAIVGGNPAQVIGRRSLRSSGSSK